MSLVKVKKAALDEVTGAVLERFNLKVHTFNGVDYAFFRRLSGDVFNYALDTSDNLNFVKVYAISQDTMKKAVRQLLYNARTNPGSNQGKYSRSDFLNFIESVYSDYEKILNDILKKSFNDNILVKLRDPNLYTQGIGKVVASSKVLGTRYAISANPFKKDEILELMTDNTLSFTETDYFKSFLSNFLSTDIMPALLKKYVGEFKSYAPQGDWIETVIANNAGFLSGVDKDKLRKFAVGKVKDFLEVLNKKKKYEITDSQPDVEVAANITSERVSFIRAVIRYAVDTGVVPSGDNSLPAESGVAGTEGQTSQDDTQKREDVFEFYRPQINADMHATIVNYFQSTFLGRSGENSDKLYRMFNEAILQIKLAVGPVANRSQNYALEMATDVKSAVEQLTGNKPMREMFTKADFEDKIDIKVTSPDFYKFITDTLIPYEKQNPKDPDNIFTGLNDPVISIDTKGSHLVLIASVASASGIPAEFAKAMASVQNTIQIYNQKYK